MDSDFDESLNDFKKTVSCNKRKAKPVKKKSSATTRKQRSEKLANKYSKQRQKIETSPSGGSSRTGSSMLPPGQILMRNSVKESAQVIEGTAHCPSCGKLFDVIELTKHATACLHANFEACRFANDSVKPLLQVVKTREIDFEKPSALNTGVSNGESYFCPNCASDLSMLCTEKRNTHINRCFDHSADIIIKNVERNPKLVQKVPPKIKRKRTQGESCRCLLCLKVLSSKNSYKRHLVSCQQKHKFSTMTAISLHRPDNDDHVDDELLAEIRRAESRVPVFAEQHLEVNQPKPKKKVAKKVQVDKKTPEEDMLQLAIGLSKNEDLEKKRTRKRKKEISVIPVMITLSPNSKRQQLQKRLYNIARPEYSTWSSNIPTTPALPVTCLKVSSNIKIISHREMDFAIDQLYSGKDDPDTWGLKVPKQLKNYQNEDIQSAPMTNIASVQETDKSTTLACQPLQSLCDVELQSSEVILSSIHNVLPPDANKNPKPTRTENSSHFEQDCKIHCSDVAASRQRVYNGRGSETPMSNSCWALANSSKLNRSLHRVCGLLSQFDNQNENSLSHDSDFPSQFKECGKGGYLNANRAIDDRDNIDSTLLALETLEEREYFQGSPTAESKNMSSRPLSSQASLMSKLIDNLSFSDAQILAGELKEPIKLHRNIILHSCPELLDEILSSENDVLCLPEFTKAEIMPMINYIYSLDIKSLQTAARVDKNAFLKTLQLLKRFNVNLTEDDRKLLDAEFGTKATELDLESLKGNSAENLSKNSSEINFKVKMDSTPTAVADSDDLLTGNVTQPNSQSSQASVATDDWLSDTHEALMMLDAQSPTTPVGGFEQFEDMPSDHDIFDFDAPILTTEITNVTNSSRFPAQIDEPTQQKELVETEKNIMRWGNLNVDQVNDQERSRTAHDLLNFSIDSELEIPNDALPVEPLSSNENIPPDFFSPKPFVEYIQTHPRLSNAKSTKSKQPVVGNSKRRSSITRYHRRKHSKHISYINKPCINKNLSSTQSLNSTDSLCTFNPVSLAVSMTNSEMMKDNESTGTFVAETCRKSILHSSNKVVCVTEILPRFKGREHKRSRCGAEKISPSQEQVKLPEASANRLSSSQPVIPKPATTEMDLILPLRKNFKFKKLKQAVYASPNMLSSTPSHTIQEIEPCVATSSESEISGYDSDGDIFSSIFFDDSFEQQCLETSNRHLTKPQLNFLCTPKTSKASHAATKKNQVAKTFPVPITPMPNFGDMETPEVLKRAAKIGLKKTLGKLKLKTKLEEEYLYKHQIVLGSDESSSEENDLCVNAAEMSRMTLHVSRLSASPGFYSAATNLYSFRKLTCEEVLELSSKAVVEMHADGMLLAALKESKEESGLIKRGSRQDQQRCWDSVTPGSSAYDPKLNAILCLPEEYQTAITTPLVRCVVEHYIDYKKQQFNCLPLICDRMEQYQEANNAI